MRLAREFRFGDPRANLLQTARERLRVDEDRFADGGEFYFILDHALTGDQIIEGNQLGSRIKQIF